MSTIEATISMLESMPEEARQKVFQYAQQLFTAHKPESPFIPVDEAQILAHLEKSRRQIDEGKGRSAQKALQDIGERHGFI